MRYFITLAFDGSPYHGWQRQPDALSVQEEVERGLATLLRHPVSVVGAGRTDVGVNARKMVAHFDLPDEPANLDLVQLAYRLNHLLPPAIYIYNVEPVAPEMHARFSAKERTYRYYIHTRRDPFLASFSLEMHYNLDFDKMNEAAILLLKHDDFGAFCKAHSDVKTTLCNVSQAQWLRLSDHSYCFEIRANRFLRNMVRAIVGTLIDVGRGRLSIDEFKAIIASGKRTEARESMPAHALFLEDITY